MKLFLFILLQAFYGWHSYGSSPDQSYEGAAVESVDAQCEYTQVTLSGIPTDSTGPDTLYLKYNNLLWINNEWTEMDTVEAFARNASDSYRLKPIYSDVSALTVYDANPDTTEDISDAGVIIDSYPLTDLKAYAFRMTYSVEGTIDRDKKTNQMNHAVDSVLTGVSAPFTVLFNANPTPRVNYIEWNILLGGSPATTPRHERTFRYTFSGSEDAQAYTVKLHCKGEPEACLHDTARLAVSVTLSKLLVPNVFTPNGDGLNDEFRVLYQSLKEFHIWVYNRWGKEVYSSTNPAVGWDGYIGGRPAAEGAYFYVVRATGTDGQVYKMGGDINLLRGNN